MSGGPFIDPTSGQMAAAAADRPVYELYLCGHQELKCIKAGNRVVTTGLPPPETKWPLWAPGLRGARGLKRYLSGSVSLELAPPTSRL